MNPTNRITDKFFIIICALSVICTVILINTPSKYWQSNKSFIIHDSFSNIPLSEYTKDNSQLAIVPSSVSINGWKGTNGLEFGRESLYTYSRFSGDKTVIELNVKGKSPDSISKTFHDLPKNSNISVWIRTTARIHLFYQYKKNPDLFDKNSINIYWNNEKVGNILPSSFKIFITYFPEWKNVRFRVNTGDKFSAHTLRLEDAANGTEYDTGLGMLISDVYITQD